MRRFTLAGGVLGTVVGLLTSGTTLAEEVGPPAPSSQPSSLILNLMNQPGPAESREKAFLESIKRDLATPQPSPLDDWVAQPDGSMRNKRSGMSIIVRNPCPPGDIEHEFALAAYNRAMTGKSRR
jgi:hypothetical protein